MALASGNVQVFSYSVLPGFGARAIHLYDKSKIICITGWLKGSAFASAVWESQPTIHSSYVYFLTVLKKGFDHHVQGKDAARHLIDIRQGSRSALVVLCKL